MDPPTPRLSPRGTALRARWVRPRRTSCYRSPPPRHAPRSTESKSREKGRPNHQMATQATIRPPQAPRHGLGATPQPPSRPKGAWGRNLPNCAPIPPRLHIITRRPLAPPARAARSRRLLAPTRSRCQLAPPARAVRSCRNQRPPAPAPLHHGPSRPRPPDTVPSAHHHFAPPPSSSPEVPTHAGVNPP